MNVFLALAVALALSSGAARAVPILSFDLDPNTPGIQSAHTVAVGDPVRVDLVVDDLPAPTSTSYVSAVQAVFFEFDAGKLTGITTGSYQPIAFLVFEPGPPGLDVVRAETNSSFPIMSGPLLFFDFVAAAPGQALFDFGATAGDFSYYEVTGATGSPIFRFVEENGGVLTIVAPGSVPSPAALPLFAVGLAGLGLAARRRTWVIKGR
jgi:hypothetical protein